MNTNSIVIYYYPLRLINFIKKSSTLFHDLSFLARVLVPAPFGLTEGSAEEKNIKKWVLTSERVYSSADKFANFCKRTGWATIIGTRTGGDGLGSTPVLLMLPDSGLLIRFSAEVGENPDGSMNAAVGTLPDVVCKSKDAFDRCLELIGGE